MTMTIKRASLVVVLCAVIIVIGLHAVEANTQQYHGDVDLSLLKASRKEFFVQRVDHFDPLNNETYSQKYYVDDSNWQPGGPIFLFLGGEAPVEFFEFQEVYARQLAQEFHAVYIALEHRFYGTSNPKPNYSTENLRFLSSRQALADAANFLVSFNASFAQQHNDNVGPWVVWGCSYSGGLSAWFRAKYPNLVVGSVAPSGPVYANNNYTGYYALFSKVADPKCVTAVQAATNKIMSMLQSAAGRAELKKTFNSCGDISQDPEENYWFLSTLTGAVGSSDQFQNPPDFPLNATCNTMLSSGDYVGNWAKVVGGLNAYKRQRAGTADLGCNDFNEMSNWINPMRNITNANRSWYFQKCTEFGYFKPTYPGTSVFFPTLHLEHRLRWCEQIFLVKNMLPDIEGTNAYYGGYDLKATNVLFTNGLIDPWHLLSIYKPLPGVQSVTYNAGHCAPMTKPTSQDEPSLIVARDRIRVFLQAILNAH